MAAVSGKPYVIREYGDNYTEQFGLMGTLRRGAEVSIPVFTLAENGR
jgi:hypothetical protein